MTRFRFTIYILLVLSFSYSAIAQHRIASPKPKLVVFFLIDELSTDQLVAFRDKFSNEGFNRLIDGGAFYRNASFPAGSVYAGCNLSTLYSGAYPSTHGIISDVWYDKLKYNKVLADAADIDKGVLPSAKNMLASTFTDELKWMYNGQSKVTSIGFNPDFLVWTGGHSPDYTYYPDETTGNMVLNADTSIIKLPDWVNEFNGKKLLDVYAERQWGPIADLSEYHQLQYFSEELPQGHTFLYSLKKGKENNVYQNVLESPYGNKLIRDFTVSQVLNGEYGKDEVTDILTVQFTTRSAHRTSAAAFEAETEDMLLRLDQEIADMLKILDSEVGLENTLVITSAIAAPVRSVVDNGRANIPTGLFSGRKAASLLNLYLMAIHGQGTWVKAYHDGQVYLNHELLEQSKISKKEILDQSAKFLMQVEGVAYALPADELMASTSDLAAMESLKLNYHPKRSGDILIRLQPGWNEEIDGKDPVHRHWTSSTVPLVFYGWKIGRRNIYEKVSMADVAPTISSFLEIPFPNGCEGKPLKEVLP
ncbi:alkaline phosphatase family protein [Carboxylicivirga caseinilyticus]|uniref:alkaline phosphatase family protein n=1 Tax=Carboxylicivirga caseinilyticus TaxID=3417572 RepID=UPI003D32D0C4|nr:alkaline phosphatase family protein [Marinilabiliaceae bacterium A049]